MTELLLGFLIGYYFKEWKLKQKSKEAIEKVKQLYRIKKAIFVDPLTNEQKFKKAEDITDLLNEK